MLPAFFQIDTHINARSTVLCFLTLIHTDALLYCILEKVVLRIFKHKQILREMMNVVFSRSDIMEEYEKEMKKLVGRLMLLMLESLGLRKEDVKWVGPTGKFEDTCAAIQLNWYPACPDPKRAMGLAEHTDSPLITILHQSSTSGLQVFREKGQRWITVHPLAGSLVVNVGDLLHILSNARFHSVLHRAVVNRTSQRLSVAYLWGPPSHIQISPSPQLVTPDRPPLYRSVSLTEYLSVKAKHFNNALNSIRRNPPLK